MIRVLDSAGSTLVEWGRQQQQHNDDGDGDDDNDQDDYYGHDYQLCCSVVIFTIFVSTNMSGTPCRDYIR